MWSSLAQSILWKKIERSVYLKQVYVFAEGQMYKSLVQAYG